MTSVEDPYESAANAAAHLRSRLGHHDVAVVLGSGWSEAVAALGTTTAELATSELPGAPVPAVPGHEGAIHSVDVARTGASNASVLVLSGRAHLYEGHPAAAVTHAVRAAVLAGCSTVVLTNAAGSLRQEVGVGSVVLIADQLNLTGDDPMRGPAPTVGPPTRFVDLSDLYSSELRERIRAARPDLAEGTYAGLRGGSFETPAEIRMLRTLGADLVGMSTVLEAIAARHLGARVVGLSLVTNLAAGMQESIDHGEVLAAGRHAVGSLAAALRTTLSAL